MTAFPSNDTDSPDDLAALFTSAEEQPPATSGAEMPDHTDADTAAEETVDDGYSTALYGEAPAATLDTPRDIDAVSTPAEDEAAGDSGDDETLPGVSTVTNPALTVSVSATMHGATHRVDLSPELTGLTESRLAREICALADLARLKAEAGMLTGMLADPRIAESARKFGLDPHEAVPDIFDRIGTPLPTPEQADAAQAEVFATLYAADS